MNEDKNLLEIYEKEHKDNEIISKKEDLKLS